MPIRVKEIPEPLSRISERMHESYPFARSQAFDALQRQMYRYLRDELRGSSVLISGHRGAGKTRLVTGVVSALQRRLREEKCGKKLLLVELHGPALAGEGKRKPTVEPPKKDAKNSDEESANSTGQQDSQKLPLISDYSPDERLLILIVIALHLGLVRDVTESFWRNPKLRSWDACDGKYAELAAEFARELDDFPTPARLREYWQRASVAESGVLFPEVGPARGGQGMRELLLISSSVEAYRRVSGSFTEHPKNATDPERQTASESSSQLNFKELLPTIIGLLSGGAVGGGAIALNQKGWTAALLGLAALLGTAAALRYASRKPASHSLPVSQTWERDLTVRTLRRELPSLIERFIDAGIYPIFFIDELDKIRNLKRFERTLQKIKVLFSENAFFCFATDREYYEEMLVETPPGRYPKSATLFRQQLFVSFLPEDFHSYLNDILS
jgi:hypothetical protein